MRGRPKAAVPTYLALVDGDVMIRVFGALIFGPRADQAVVVELLNDMGGPSADAGDGEDRGEQIHIDAQGVVGRGRIKIHISIQLLVGLYELFDLVRDLKPLPLPTGVAQIATHHAQVRGAGIFGVVDAMAKAGNLLLLGQHAFDVIDGIGAGTVNRFENAEDGLVGAAVQRPFERTDGGSDGRM